MNKTLNYYLEQARVNHYALGHFNFATADVLKGIVSASQGAGAPSVMVGTSEGEVEFFGIKEAVAAVRAIRERFDFPVFLNADHFKSFEKCKEAIDAGYDSVLIDSSNLPYEENVAVTKKVVDYAIEISKFRHINISTEGELGCLRGSSEVQTKIDITPNDFTKPEEAREFIEKTGVDRLAVVFGNIHGIVTEQEVRLDMEHFLKIVKHVEGAPPHNPPRGAIYFVLHGASGLKDDDVAEAIREGIVNVHYNTELRVAYRKGLEKAFQENPNQTTPYKYLIPAVEEVKKVVAQKTRIFGGK